MEQILKDNIILLSLLTVLMTVIYGVLFFLSWVGLLYYETEIFTVSMYFKMLLLIYIAWMVAFSIATLLEKFLIKMRKGKGGEQRKSRAGRKNRSKSV